MGEKQINGKVIPFTPRLEVKATCPDLTVMNKLSTNVCRRLIQSKMRRVGRRKTIVDSCVPTLLS